MMRVQGVAAASMMLFSGLLWPCVEGLAQGRFAVTNLQMLKAQTLDPVNHQYPRWSLDGRHLSFETLEAEYIHLYLTGFQGTPFKLVPAGRGSGYQAVASVDNVDEVQLYLGQDVAPGFFAWLVPTRGGRALVGLLARRHAQDRLASFIRRLETEGKIQGIIEGSSSWGLPLRPLKRTFRDRVLVVGDAAGQVKPTTGGGIFYSLLASEIAVSVLGEALAVDDLSSAKLSQYQTEWKALLARELEIGYSARRLYEYLSDRQVSSLVQQAASKGVCSDLTGGPDMSFDWHSRIIARVMGHPALGSGLRLINPLLARLACRPNPNLAAQTVSSTLPTQFAEIPD